MSKKSRDVTKVTVAEPTIDAVLDEFLRDQEQRLAKRTHAEYLNIVDLLRYCLDQYAYQGLSGAELALYERLHGAGDLEEERGFCGIFGPSHIPDHLGMFLDYFMIRKVMASENAMRAAGTVTRKLCQWLAQHGHITHDEGAEGVERGAEAARELPRARRAADLLADGAAELAVDSQAVADHDYLEFDHYEIVKVEPGRLWFGLVEGRRRCSIGPVPVPTTASDLLHPGWTVSCALGRIGGVWRILEAANVYPQ
jgi:hypothetical protein